MMMKFLLHHILAKLAVNLSLEDVSTSSQCLISAVKSQSVCVNCGDVLYPYLHSKNLPLLHWPWLMSLCCNYVYFPMQCWKHPVSGDSSVEWRCRGLLMQEAAIDESCRARLLILMKTWRELIGPHYGMWPYHTIHWYRKWQHEEREWWTWRGVKWSMWMSKEFYSQYVPCYTVVQYKKIGTWTTKEQRLLLHMFYIHLSWHFILLGVRDSVSHTNRPGNPSQTAEPPVLLDLPENRSTIL